MLRKSIPVVLIAAACAGLVNPAAARDERLPMMISTTGSIGTPSGAPPSSSTPAPWSGTSGASGHPLMEAAAIRVSAANFSRCIEGKWPLAAQRGISRASFDHHTARLTPDLRIMDLLDAQPEFTKSVWEYLDLLVSDARIQKGREILAAHRPIFDAVERAYGVDRHVVAAIWGVETNFSTIIGERPVIRSTATLACVGRRQEYFTEEFLSALEILHRGDVRAEQLIGSWAGAFGPTQFMPTTFKQFAVDFDGDGRRDIVGSVGDLVASTANNLKKNGWQREQTWGYEVVLPKDFNYLLADRSRQLTIGQWRKLGLQRVGARPFPRLGERAYLMMPAGARGPAFLMLGNFRSIMKYNPAEAYALAIGHLADRLRGGEPLVQPWPRDEQMLSRNERAELQQHLASRGFDVGGVDGHLGSKTRAAIRDFQASVGLAPDGFASGTVLTRLRNR